MQLRKVSRWQILTAKLCQVRSIPICEKSLCAVCRQIIILCSANWKTHSRSRLVHNLKPTSPNNCCSARLFFSGKKHFLFNFFDHSTVIVPHYTKPKGFVAGNLSHGELCNSLEYDTSCYSFLWRRFLLVTSNDYCGNNLVLEVVTFILKIRKIIL